MAEAGARGSNSRLARVRKALRSPSGVRLALPLVVALVALIQVAVAGVLLRGTLRANARERLFERVSKLEGHIQTELHVAEQVLDFLAADLAERGADPDRLQLARRFKVWAEARPLLAYISVSREDGTFQGIYREADGSLTFQESRVDESGSTLDQRYHYSPGAESLVLVRSDLASRYDPRQRGFYKEAKAAGRRIWTAPYLFFNSWATGVSCAQPWVGPDGSFRGVLTVDVDISSLSHQLRTLPWMAGTDAALFEPGGTLLGTNDLAPLSGPPPERLASTTDLRDPLLRSTAGWATTEGNKPEEAERASRAFFEGERLAAVRTFAPVEGKVWWAAVASDDPWVERELKQLLKTSLPLVLLALLASIALGALLAEELASAVGARNRAEKDAAHARGQAEALGAYRLVRMLGQGGMGEVWEVEHRQLARPAAMKLLRKEHTRDVDLVARFEREARTIARLRCPHTVSLYDFGFSEDGALFYVMELLTGLDLDELVREYGPQPPARVVAILLEVCDSLSEAHEQGLVHRDIKPANVYLCRLADTLDHVKVLDFGLVGSQRGVGRELTHLTASGQVAGTPAFMAPDQVLDVALDGRTDLYALGCVAFWLLTGREPYEKPSASELMLAHVQLPPPRLAPHCPVVLPPRLVELIESCMAKKKEDRPASARAMAEALASIDLSGCAPWRRAEAERWWRELPPRPAPAPGDATPSDSGRRTFVRRRPG